MTSDINDDALICFQKEGYIYTGFRHYPSFELRLTDQSPIAILVRDPRDMLVSLYYSVRDSHEIPSGHEHLTQERQKSKGAVVDEWVSGNFLPYIDAFNQYQERLKGLPVVTFRYEDVIYDREAWLSALVNCLGLPFDKGVVKRVAATHEKVPKAESPADHIRQVHPGDHRRKLRGDTIGFLTERLEEFLRFYGYNA